jgi:hypothetical protein
MKRDRKYMRSFVRAIRSLYTLIVWFHLNLASNSKSTDDIFLLSKCYFFFFTTVPIHLYKLITFFYHVIKL